MEIKINKDISKYKTKDVFIFSMGEFVYVVIAVVLGYGGKVLTNLVIDNNDISLFVGVALASIPILLGFYKPKGYKAIDYIRLVWLPSMTTSKEKIWKSDFVFEEYFTDEELKEQENYEQGEKEL